MSELSLHEAAVYGDRRRISEVLADGADVNAFDKFRMTAFELAQVHRRRAAAQLLAAHGAQPLPTKYKPNGLDQRTVARLLARLGRDRASLLAPTGTPDPALARVLRGGRVTGTRLVLDFDVRPLPPAVPATRRAILHALGNEALRWLREARVELRGELELGGAHPWYTLAPKAVAKARKLVAAISH